MAARRAAAAGAQALRSGESRLPRRRNHIHMRHDRSTLPLVVEDVQRRAAMWKRSDDAGRRAGRGRGRAPAEEVEVSSSGPQRILLRTRTIPHPIPHCPLAKVGGSLCWAPCTGDGA